MRTLLLFLAACAPEAPVTAISVDAERALAEVSPQFLSFAIDSSNIANAYDFTRPRLRRMTAELAPALLRIGGTNSDTTHYDLSDNPVAAAAPPDKAVLTRAWWDAACDFAGSLGLELLFTLNAGPAPRDAGGSWVADNSRQLIEYTRAHGCPVSVWELGNEINAFGLLHDLPLDGKQYAADVAVARALIDAVDPTARLAGPAIAYWPLWGEIVPTMADFLAAGGQLVDVITWHYYPQQSSLCPVASRPAEMDTLLDPANLDEVQVWAHEVESLSAGLGAEIWLGESGHAQCGGEPGISDRFVTGFWWLDELAQMAARGQPVVVRQALTGGRYHLIDNNTLEPRPDYFNSLLWKRLMGARSLAVRRSDGNPLLRVYAHCGAKEGVTMLALNLDRLHAVSVSFPGMGGRRELYQLTGELLSSEVRLNDVALAVAADGSPPSLSPRATSDAIRLPPLSYAFIGLPDAVAAACP